MPEPSDEFAPTLLSVHFYAPGGGAHVEKMGEQRDGDHCRQRKAGVHRKIAGVIDVQVGLSETHFSR